MSDASMKCPKYKMNLIDSSGTKYQLKNITTDLIVGQEENDLSEKVNITFANLKVGNKQLSSLVKIRQRAYVYADTGSGYKEVFRGYVWERKFDRSIDVKDISLVCYDRLIYLQNSKDNFYRKKGAKTKDVITSIAKKWGVKIKYNYVSIIHGKLVYRSEYISDIIVSILNKAKKKTGIGYVIRCEKGVMVIEKEGSNSTVYKVESGDNSISQSYTESMDGMITKVKIVKAETVKKKDSEKETGRYVTVANVKGNVKEYGTLQDIIEKGSDEKLSEAKKEANNIIKKDGHTKKDITVTAVDNPWIKKGHKVYINSGVLKNNYIVKGIEHDATKHIMILEVKKA